MNVGCSLSAKYNRLKKKRVDYNTRKVKCTSMLQRKKQTNKQTNKQSYSDFSFW